MVVKWRRREERYPVASRKGYPFRSFIKSFLEVAMAILRVQKVCAAIGGRPKTPSAPL
jgi:hypothetical protein